jgi:hypothetical protein
MEMPHEVKQDGVIIVRIANVMRSSGLTSRA